MRDPIVDDPAFEPVDALLEEVMRQLPPPVRAVPRSRHLAAALVVLGCAAVAGTALLRDTVAPAQQPQQRAGPDLVVPKSRDEYLRLVAEARAVVLQTQHIESFDRGGTSFMARDPEPRTTVAVAGDVAKWRQWLTAAAGEPQAQRTDDVVSVVLSLDLGGGRVLELIAHMEDGTLLAGPGAGPFALRGELLATLQNGRDELVRQRRLLEGRVANLEELGQLPASIAAIEWRATKDLAGQLGRFRQLRRLQLLGADVLPDAASLASLAQLPALTELHVFAGNLTDPDLAVLAKFPTLRHLALWRGSRITGRGLGAVRQLQSVSLGNCALDADGMRALAGLPALTGLTLGSNVDPELCGLLPSFPFLRQLRLLGAGDDCLPHVLLTKVEALQLSGRCTGAGLATLARLPSLHELVLAGTSLRDDDVDGLGALSGLQRLDLRCTLVSAAGVDQVRKLLPRCEVLAAPGRIFQVWVKPSDDVDDTQLTAHWCPLPPGWLLATQ